MILLTSTTPAPCRVTRQPEQPMHEVVAYRAGAAPAGWPAAPGGAVRDGSGRPAVAHFAPGRWLVPTSGLDLTAWFAVAAPLCSVVDVTGKWCAFAVAGPGSRRLLQTSIAIDAVLDGRDCAAVVLFDCPAVVARTIEGYIAWVQASYAADFLTAALRFGAVD